MWASHVVRDYYSNSEGIIWNKEEFIMKNFLNYTFTLGDSDE